MHKPALRATNSRPTGDALKTAIRGSRCLVETYVRGSPPGLWIWR